VSKDSPHTRLLEAIRVIHEGHSLIDPVFTTHLIQEFVQYRRIQQSELPSFNSKSMERLTLREIEILYLIGQGKSNAQIAQKLHVAEVTVKSHVHQLLRKLSMTSRMQLAIFANEMGLKESDFPPSKD
jgi:DNA-binding NarL/FixJ family response regulator